VNGDKSGYSVQPSVLTKPVSRSLPSTTGWSPTLPTMDRATRKNGRCPMPHEPYSSSAQRPRSGTLTSSYWRNRRFRWRCSSLWLAFHDDLADRKATTPSPANPPDSSVQPSVARKPPSTRKSSASGCRTTLWRHAFVVKTGVLKSACFRPDRARDELLPWIKEYSH